MIVSTSDIWRKRLALYYELDFIFSIAIIWQILSQWPSNQLSMSAN